MIEETTVRQNLMDNAGYRPYCGAAYDCYMPRTHFRPSDGQFICPNCKWVSAFPQSFIDRYVKKHNIKLDKR